ncbi:MAG: YybH family protein [Hyphomicrobiales bacterium]
MRYLIAALLLVGAVSPASAGPKEDAFAVIEQFKKSFDASDPPAIVKLFAPDAVFLGTTMQRPTRDKEAILKYFQASASANLPKKVEIENYEVLQLSESAVLFTGQDTFSQTRDGKTIETPARFTFVITKDAQGWGIGHFHSSMRPSPQ